jgi:hypothetical protein
MPDAKLPADFGDYKDTRLADLKKTANVAQFVSYSPELRQRHSLIRGYEPDHHFENINHAVDVLFRMSSDRRVNVRSFSPKSSKGNAFLYGLETVDDVVCSVRQLAEKGLITIVNETIDVHDGGVSGVVHGDIIEFSPGSTPRCVEEAGITTLRRDLGTRLLEVVYGFKLELEFDSRSRVEFSIHPIQCGYRNSHTLVWEIEQTPTPTIDDEFPRWPSRFSRLLGDKAFGLLVAHLAGLRIPSTLVIPRHLAPFQFGRRTCTGETWIRTCPNEQVPGKYTTRRGWVDPFKLMMSEDAEGNQVASVICQDGVDAQYSGALRTLESAEPLVEGVVGTGERFMLGEVSPEPLPDNVISSVRDTFESAVGAFGPVRMEWVFDGEHVWVVQLHRQPQSESAWMIYPGNPSRFLPFEVSRGLAELRSLIESVEKTGEGVRLIGNVGRTSHMCDLLRQARIPSFQERGP